MCPGRELLVQAGSGGFHWSISSFTSGRTRAGCRQPDSSGITFLLYKSKPPMIEWAPTSTRSIITAFIPTRTFSPMCAPCTTAPWPMWGTGFQHDGDPGNICTVQFSCTLLPSPTRISPQSARRTALGPIYTSRPMITLPMTVAWGCTKEEGGWPGWIRQMNRSS